MNTAHVRTLTAALFDLAPVFEVDVAIIDHVRKAIAKVSKRSQKCGGEGIDFEIVGEGRETRTTVYEGGVTRERTRHLQVLRLNTTTAPRLPGGWRLVAALDRPGSVNIIRKVPGVDVEIPAKWWTADLYCEHCNTRRARKNTFLIAKEGSDELICVGRNCLKDFTGHRSPAAVARWFECISHAFDALRAYGEATAPSEGGAKWEMAEDTRDLLVQSAAIIRVDGFRPARADFSTVQAYCYSCWPPRETMARKQWLAWCEKRAPTAGDVAMADAVIEWAEAIDLATATDYLRNVKGAVCAPYVGRKALGLAVSAIAAYKREQGQADAAAAKARAEAERPETRHVGDVGGKIEVTATVTAKRGFEGAYGWTNVYTFTTDDGDSLVWFTGKELEHGETYTVKATVKAHDEYRGTKQTKITRARCAAA